MESGQAGSEGERQGRQRGRAEKGSRGRETGTGTAGQEAARHVAGGQTGTGQRRGNGTMGRGLASHPSTAAFSHSSGEDELKISFH